MFEGLCRLSPEQQRRPEAGFRETYSFSSLFVPHPFLGFAPNPEHPSFSEQGFRDHRKFGRDTSAFRIVCLGGSATYGSRVERADAFPAQLERRLQEHGRNAEVINAGVHAYSAANIIGYLSLRIVDLKPKLAVFYVGFNDMWSWVFFPDFKSDYSHMEKVWAMPDLDPPFWTRSALLRRITGWQPPLVHIHAVAFKPFSDNHEANFQAADTAVFGRNLITLAAICRAHGIRPIFVPEATDFTGHPEAEHPEWRATDQKAIERAREIMAEVARSQSVDLIATDSISDHAEYFADCVHLNEAGNRALAGLIADYLMRQSDVFSSGAENNPPSPTPAAPSPSAQTNP